MDSIQTAFIYGLIVGLIPSLFIGITYLAWNFGVRTSERKEIKRLQRKALERLAGER